MAKKNKSVLNQKFNDLYEKNDIVEEEINLTEVESNVVEEIIENDIIEDQIGENDDNVLIEGNVEIQPEIIENVKIIKPKRTINSLTKSEYRYYLRTGIIPE